MADIDYIAIPRGDCKVINVEVRTDGDPLEIGAEDRMELTVRAKPDPDSPILLHKLSEPGSGVIEIHTEDTIKMEPGRYSADIRYHRDGCIYTLWGIEDTGVKIKALKNFYILAGVSADG